MNKHNYSKRCNILLSVTKRISIYFQKWLEKMNNMIKNFELISIYRTLYRIHNLFKYWGNIKRKWLYAGLKASLNFRNCNIQILFSNYNVNKIETRTMTTRKIPLFWKRRHILPNIFTWLEEGNKIEIWDFFKLNKNANITYQNLWEKMPAHKAHSPSSFLTSFLTFPPRHSIYKRI